MVAPIMPDTAITAIGIVVGIDDTDVAVCGCKGRHSEAVRTEQNKRRVSVVVDQAYPFFLSSVPVVVGWKRSLELIHRNTGMNPGHFS